MRFSFDLHMHSCLSPCGGEESTPANLAAMCALAGLDIVALTDHNTTGNCRAFLTAAKSHDLLALPGMELTTLEEVHVICLFSDLERAEAFGDYVRLHLPPLRNDPDLFGAQIRMDAGDTVLGEETRLLSTATDIGVYEAAGLVSSYGGVAYPAHIDRPSFSLLSNLGFWDKAMGFPLAEVSPHCPSGLFDRADLRGVRHIVDCDAHYLDQIPDAHQFMDLPAKTAQNVLIWLNS